MVILVKPQFEVGKGQVGKGGIVRDPALHHRPVCAWKPRCGNWDSKRQLWKARFWARKATRSFSCMPIIKTVGLICQAEFGRGRRQVSPETARLAGGAPAGGALRPAGRGLRRRRALRAGASAPRSSRRLRPDHRAGRRRHAAFGRARHRQARDPSIPGEPGRPGLPHRHQRRRNLPRAGTRLPRRTPHRQAQAAAHRGGARRAKWWPATKRSTTRCSPNRRWPA